MTRRRRQDHRHLWLGIALALIAAAATYVSTTAVNGGPLASQRTVRIVVPAGGPIVKPGDDVRIDGVRAGQVSSVGLEGGRAVATLAIGHDTLRRDATARVQLRGLAGAVDVELDPGRAAAALPDDAELPAGSAHAGTQLTGVIAGFDAATRRALARTLSAYGAGVAGRGEALNRTLANLGPALEGATPLLRALHPGVGDLVAQADRVASAVPPGDLAGLVASARTVVATTAARSRAVAGTIDAAPALEAQAARTLPVADRLLDRLSPTLRDLEPGVRTLSLAAVDLRAIERRTPALTALARVGRIGAPVLRAATPVVAGLYPTTASLAALAPPAGVLASGLIPYGTELVEAPAGFTRWGDYAYPDGRGAGHRAVRFTMVFTCAKARDPYPAPGAAAKEHEPCRG